MPLMLSACQLGMTSFLRNLGAVQVEKGRARYSSEAFCLQRSDGTKGKERGGGHAFSSTVTLQNLLRLFLAAMGGGKGEGKEAASGQFIGFFSLLLCPSREKKREKGGERAVRTTPTLVSHRGTFRLYHPWRQAQCGRGGKKRRRKRPSLAGSAVS